MDNLLPKNEYKEVEGRYYADPNVALNESNQFIDNLRNVQNQQNQEIAQQTYDLGTDIESVKGGLGTNTTNDLSYFTSRYQVPQTTSVVANLRTAAQAAALNQVLSDEQEMWKKRYQDAYRNYQKRANRGTGGTGGTGDNGEPDIDLTTAEEGNAWGTMRSNAPGTTVTANGSVTRDPNTGELIYGYDVVDNETGKRLSTTEDYTRRIKSGNELIDKYVDYWGTVGRALSPLVGITFK